MERAAKIPAPRVLGSLAADFDSVTESQARYRFAEERGAPLLGIQQNPSRLGGGCREHQTGDAPAAPQVEMGSGGFGKQREESSAVYQVLSDRAGSEEAPRAGLLEDLEEFFLSR